MEWFLFSSDKNGHPIECVGEVEVDGDCPPLIIWKGRSFVYQDNGGIHVETALFCVPPEDLTIAPGAADLTFGSVLDTMISRSFRRIDGRAGPEGRFYTDCFHCDGTDKDRPQGERPSIHRVQHDANCLLAKHLPRLRAMANKGST